MGLFSSYKRSEASAPTSAPAPVDDSRGPVKKSVPTPTRRQAEDARRQRLNPKLTPKEAKAKAKEQDRASRQRSMLAQDNTPAKVLLRDHIDARFSVAEITMPVMLVMVGFTFAGDWGRQFLVPVTLVTYGFLLLAFADLTWMWLKFRDILKKRLPNESKKGLLFYAINRALSFRKLRFPAPRVKIGAKY